MSCNASQTLTGISLITTTHLLLPRKVIPLLGAATADVSTARSIGHFLTGENRVEETDRNMTVGNIATLLRGECIFARRIGTNSHTSAKSH